MLNGANRTIMDALAEHRKLSKNRMLLELIENGIDAKARKQEQFFPLAERFAEASRRGKASRR